MCSLFKQIVVKGEGIIFDGVRYPGAKRLGVEPVGGIFDSKEGYIGC
jgi:hypothetical protein